MSRRSLRSCGLRRRRRTSRPHLWRSGSSWATRSTTTGSTSAASRPHRTRQGSTLAASRRTKRRTTRSRCASALSRLASSCCALSGAVANRPAPPQVARALWAIAWEKAKQEVSLNKVNVYETAFARIKKATVSRRRRTAFLLVVASVPPANPSAPERCCQKNSAQKRSTKLARCAGNRGSQRWRAWSTPLWRPRSRISR